MWDQSDGSSHSHPLPSHPFAATLPTVSKLPALPPVQSISDGGRESTAVSPSRIHPFISRQRSLGKRAATDVQSVIANGTVHSSSVIFPSIPPKVARGRLGGTISACIAILVSSYAYHQVPFIRSDESANRQRSNACCFTRERKASVSREEHSYENVSGFHSRLACFKRIPRRVRTNLEYLIK